MFSSIIDSDRVAEEFGGGFPEEALVYLEGDSGTGKSVFSQRLMYGFLENGLDVSYLSPQIETKNLIKQMRSLNYDVLDYLITYKKLNFKPVNLNTKRVLFSDASKGRELLTNIASEDFWESDIIIIDSLDTIIKNDPVFQGIDEDNKKYAIRNFTQFIKNHISETGSTVIITANGNNIKDEYIEPIANDSHVYLSLLIDSTGVSKTNKIDVKKYQMSTDDIDKTIKFTVQSGSGLRIDRSGTV